MRKTGNVRIYMQGLMRKAGDARPDKEALMRKLVFVRIYMQGLMRKAGEPEA